MEGHYDHPIYITFPAGSIVLTGEGGNRHLILKNETGGIDLWIDLHTSKYAAYICHIDIYGEPGARFMKSVYEYLNRFATSAMPRLTWFNYSKDALNELFAHFYDNLKGGFWY